MLLNLTKSQIDILRLVARGKSNREISQQLSIELSAVVDEVTQMKKTLETDRTGIAVWFIKSSLYEE